MTGTGIEETTTGGTKEGTGTITETATGATIIAETETETETMTIAEITKGRTISVIVTQEIITQGIITEETEVFTEDSFL
jgi:hypothetical protein